MLVLAARGGGGGRHSRARATLPPTRCLRPGAPRPDDASCPPAGQVRRRQVRSNLTELPQCDEGGEAEAAPGGLRRGGPARGRRAAPARSLHLCRTRLLARRRERGGDGGGRSGGGDRGSVSAAAEAPLERLPPCAPGPPRGATQRSLAPVISSHSHRRLTVPAPGGPPSAAVLSNATLSDSAPPAAPKPRIKNLEKWRAGCGASQRCTATCSAAAPAVIVACCC